MIVDTVICGECKWYYGGGCINKAVMGMNIWKERGKEDYCSLGERKDQDEQRRID